MNNISSKPTNITRTFATVTNCRLDNIIIDRITHTVTLSADGQGVLTATVDGVQVDVQTADRLLCWAKQDGSVTVLETVRGVEGISKGEASNLHRVLGRLGFKNHAQVAADVLGRMVASFTQLSRDEARLVRSYAHGQMGLVG